MLHKTRPSPRTWGYPRRTDRQTDSGRDHLRVHGVTGPERRARGFSSRPPPRTWGYPFNTTGYRTVVEPLSMSLRRHEVASPSGLASLPVRVWSRRGCNTPFSVSRHRLLQTGRRLTSETEGCLHGLTDESVRIQRAFRYPILQKTIRSARTSPTINASGIGDTRTIHSARASPCATMSYRAKGSTSSDLSRRHYDDTKSPHRRALPGFCRPFGADRSMTSD